jgi:hypothetical protein
VRSAVFLVSIPSAADLVEKCNCEVSLHAAGMDGAVVSECVRGWRKAGGEYDWRRAGGAIRPRADVRTRRTIRHSVIIHVKEPLMTNVITGFGT